MEVLPVLAVISQTVVLTWLAKAPIVTQLSVSSTLNPAENSQLSGFLNHVSALESLSICLRFRTSDHGCVRSLMNTTARIHSLNLVQEHDADDLDILIDTWLATQSPFLQHLTYQQHDIALNLTSSQEKALQPHIISAGNFNQPFHETGHVAAYIVNILSRDAQGAEAVPPYPGLYLGPGLGELGRNLQIRCYLAPRILESYLPQLQCVHSSVYFVAKSRLRKRVHGAALLFDSHIITY